MPVVLEPMVKSPCFLSTEQNDKVQLKEGKCYIRPNIPEMVFLTIAQLSEPKRHKEYNLLRFNQ